MTEKFSFGWELNHMPLTFQVSALTARPLMIDWLMKVKVILEI